MRNYQVVDNFSGVIIREFDILCDAKKCARAAGSTGKRVLRAKSFQPIAHVIDIEGYLVYKPRFKADA